MFQAMLVQAGCRIDSVVMLASYVVKKAPFAPSPVGSASGCPPQFFPRFSFSGVFGVLMTWGKVNLVSFRTAPPEQRERQCSEYPTLQELPQ
jgi:hypothetical protein